MFLAAEKLSEAGAQVEYLHNCSDPDCLGRRYVSRIENSHC